MNTLLNYYQIKSAKYHIKKFTVNVNGYIILLALQQNSSKSKIYDSWFIKRTWN